MSDTWNLIRIGEVTGVDHARARVQVTFEDLDITSDWLPVLQQGASGLEGYWLPSIGDQVVCAFYSDGTEEGVCLGSYYRTSSPPSDGGAGVYYSIFPDGSKVVWDNGTLLIEAQTEVLIDAPSSTFTGDLSVGGELTVTGDATISGVCRASDFDTIP